MNAKKNKKQKGVNRSCFVSCYISPMVSMERHGEIVELAEMHSSLRRPESNATNKTWCVLSKGRLTFS